MCYGVHVKARIHLWGVSSVFYHVDSGHGTQFLRLERRHLTLSYLAGPVGVLYDGFASLPLFGFC